MKPADVRRNLEVAVVSHPCASEQLEETALTLSFLEDNLPQATVSEALGLPPSHEGRDGPGRLQPTRALSLPEFQEEIASLLASCRRRYED